MTLELFRSWLCHPKAQLTNTSGQFDHTCRQPNALQYYQGLPRGYWGSHRSSHLQNHTYFLVVYHLPRPSSALPPFEQGIPLCREPFDIIDKFVSLSCQRIKLYPKSISSACIAQKCSSNCRQLRIRPRVGLQRKQFYLKSRNLLLRA